jgi:hypothetical protein
VSKLPDKPSELIRVALADLEKCELDDSYRISMKVWHEMAKGEPVCVVCLAGSVMAKTLGIQREESNPWTVLEHDDDTKLDALNYLRAGDVEYALEALGFASNLQDRLVTPYEVDSAAFKSDMLAIAAELEAEGL